MLANSVKNQVRQIFQNIEILLDAVRENEFDTIKGGLKHKEIFMVKKIYFDGKNVLAYNDF
jgi:hypothetical protein